MEQKDKQQEVKISDLPSNTRILFSKEIHPEEPQENSIYQAARCGNLPVIRKILETHRNVNQKDNLGNTPLFYSVHTSQEAAALLLIEMGADVNIQNNRGDSPLHEAVFYEQEQMAELLIKQGVNLTSKNCMHLTPLGITVTKSNEFLSKLLIEAGADVNVRVGASDTSETLLHLAVSSSERNINIIELLLSSGANVHARAGLFGYTPLYYSIPYGYVDVGISWLFPSSKNETEKLLRKYGAS